MLTKCLECTSALCIIAIYICINALWGITVIYYLLYVCTSPIRWQVLWLKLLLNQILLRILGICCVDNYCVWIDLDSPFELLALWIIIYVYSLFNLPKIKKIISTDGWSSVRMAEVDAFLGSMGCILSLEFSLVTQQTAYVIWQIGTAESANIINRMLISLINHIYQYGRTSDLISSPEVGMIQWYIYVVNSVTKIWWVCIYEVVKVSRVVVIYFFAQG